MGALTGEREQRQIQKSMKNKIRVIESKKVIKNHIINSLPEIDICKLVFKYMYIL